MEETLLLRLSLAVSIIGLALLFLASKFVQLEPTKIEDLCSKQLNDKARIKGRIEGVKELDKAYVIEVAQEKTVSVTVFKGDSVSFRPGQFVDVVGRLQEYRGKRQVVADKVRIFQNVT